MLIEFLSQRQCGVKCRITVVTVILTGCDDWISVRIVICTCLI